MFTISSSKFENGRRVIEKFVIFQRLMKLYIFVVYCQNLMLKHKRYVLCNVNVDFDLVDLCLLCNLTLLCASS